MCRVLLANPFIKSNSGFYAKVVSANSNIAYLEGNIDQAIEYGEQSILLEPSKLQYYQNQALLMISIKEFNLKRSVGQREGCVCGGAGQDATTRNSPLFQGVATPPCATTSVPFTL
jgi:hypothetical protein